MFIHNLIYTTAVVAISIGVFYGLSALIRRKLKNKNGFVIGLFLGGVVFAALQFGIGRVYVIDPELEVETYRVFGTITFDFDNGHHYSGRYNPDSVVVLNNSAVQLRLEELVYSLGGNTSYGSHPFHVPAFSGGTFSLPGNRIYYFFDEEIDRKIQEAGTKNVSRYWLHEE